MSNESHSIRYFLIGVVIMLAVIFLAFAAQGNSPTVQGNCQDAAGLGC